MGGGSCTQLPLPMRAKFGMLEKTYRQLAKFYLDRSILSHLGGEGAENRNFSRFLDFSILLCRQLARYEEIWKRLQNLNLTSYLP